MTLMTIYKPLRRYSYPITTGLGAVILFYFLPAEKYGVWQMVAPLALVAVAFIVWRRFRPGASEIEDAASVFNMIGSGRPVFLNIYSNY